MTSQLEESFKGPGLTLTFLYYFGVAILIVAIATMEILHVGAHSAIPYQYGVAFALPFALINAVTKRSKTLSVSVQNPHQFAQQIQSTLKDLKYEADGEPEVDQGVRYVTYRKPGLAGWLSGQVYVAIAPDEAVIASRSALIKQLEALL